MKRTVKCAVALMLLLSVLLPLAGCHVEPEAPAEGTYTVTVVDGGGKPYTSGVIVQILHLGQNVAMAPVNAEGKVEKTLPLGDYTVQLQFTGDASGFYYDAKDLTLSAEKTSLEIPVLTAITADSVQVYDSDGEAKAYPIDLGHTYVKLTPGKRSYFLFATKTAGVYRLSTSDPKAAIGNYGYTSYIQRNSISKIEEDGSFTLTLTKSMVNEAGQQNPFVIGVDSDGLEGCVVSIERIGDPPYSIEEDEPWYIYEPSVQLTPYTMPEGTLEEFDLTASSDTYQLVFNEEDKTYHLGTADGPQVLVQLGKPTKYLEAISTICTTTGLKKYFYDADGKFVKREDYTSCLQTYSNTSDENGQAVYLDKANGVYPLTEDLKYIIQNHGEYVGWWDSESHGFIFQDAEGNKLVGLNPDIAWLFLCCYLEQ